MAAAHVQTQSATASSGTAAVTFDAAAGNKLVIVLCTDGTNTPTQTTGQTVTSRRTFSSSGEVIRFYELDNVQEASQTFTFTFTSQPWTMFVMEFSGMLSGTSYDSAAGADQAFNAGPITTITGPTSGTIGQADEVLITAINADGSGPCSFTSTTNSFLVPSNGDRMSSGSCPSLVLYRIVSSVATYQTSPTVSDTVAASASITGWKAATAVSGAPNLLLRGVASLLPFWGLLALRTRKQWHPRGHA